MSAALRHRAPSAAPEHAVLTLRVAAATDRGRVRTRNEDSHAILDLTPDVGPLSSSGRIDVGSGGVLLAVADGMGGHADGDVASKMAIAALSRVAKQVGDSAALRLSRGFEEAQWDVRAGSAGRHGSQRMGTTLTAILVDGDHAHVAHVGDSRAYVIRGGGIQRLTKDQTYTEALVEAGLIKDGERDLSPFPHALLQAIGQERILRPFTSHFPLCEGDTLLLCSDGLTNLVDDDELGVVVRTGGPFEETCRALVDLANLRGGTDNVTVVLAGVRGVTARLPTTEPPPSTPLRVVT